MKRLTLLISTLLILLFSKALLADCLACWELKYVRITLDSKEEIEGYFKWNEIWPKVFNKEKKELKSFYQEVMVYMNYTGLENLILYRQIYEIEDPLNFYALYTITDLVDTVDIENINKIEVIGLHKKIIRGAGDITNQCDKM